MFSTLLLLCCIAPPPEASFALDDGDVVIRLSRGNPAEIKVYAPGPVADGETDEKGVGRFPMLPVKRFWVGIKIAGKECDLVPLELHGDRLTPARVSLTFGTRPCCKAPVKPRAD